MKQAIIACEMLRDELCAAMEKLHIDTPVIWLEKGLHDVPENLKRKLQETIDEMEQDYDLLLLTLPYCGGALNGIHCSRARLVAPRFDDCIRLLLSQREGQRNEADCHTLYYTAQWLSSERYLLRDFEDYQRRYGEKKAKKVQKAMLMNYRDYCMVDTGAYDLAALRPQAQEDAAKMDLAYTECPGTLRVLEKLLLHEFDEEFCIAEPGESFSTNQFLMA